ncbi:MAG TPA: AI-2E family transporter, partial [Candidatus Thermoplasmatota archaeon]|nr:AI-2E family transporter [Candidatus Thermoplasmatota archaeon]
RHAEAGERRDEAGLEPAAALDGAYRVHRVVGVAYAIADDAVDAVRAIERSGGLETGLVAALTGFGVPEATAQEIYRDAVGNLGNIAQASVLPTLTKLGSAAANIGVFVFLLFFLLLEGQALSEYVGRAMPLPPARRTHLMEQVGGRVRALFLGTFLVALVQGSLATLGWWIFGFPAPIFWGFVMTVLAVIPAIGPVIVMVPAGIIAIAQGDLWQGGGLIAYALIVVTFSDNLVRPFIVGRSSGVHPALVLLGTLGGLLVFGTTGFILGPLVLSMVEPVLTEWESMRPGPG